jgi:hypothetical protein
VNRLLRIATALPMLAWAVMAQDPALADKVKAEVQMKLLGAVKGMLVKGAPYSGEEVNETNQVLADGTRIHRETRATVYRDSEGRTRRETPDSIIITDPVAGVTYMLNPKNMTGQKMTTSNVGFAYYNADHVVTSGGGAGVGVGGGSGNGWNNTATFSMRMESNGGTPTITVNGQTLDPKQVQELIAKAKASGDRTITINGATVEAGMLADATARMGKVQMEAAATSAAAAGAKAEKAFAFARVAKGEPIGTQMIEGVKAEGRRNVSTIEAGSIGNDRPIQVTSESWYSPELQTVVMSKHSDPRTGEENFRLLNVNRNEPGAYLFQPPSGYSINDRK